jgi:hypothetical protein
MLYVAPDRSIHLARAEWEANSKPAPRMRQQGRREVKDQFRQRGNVIAILEWTDVCIISKIETLHPYVGAATDFLQFLKRLATQHKITLFGNATAYRPDEQMSEVELVSQEQLEKWYEKHGFQLHNGSLGVVEIWYPRTPYAAQPSGAANAAQPPYR